MMNYAKQQYVVDDVIKPEETNKWEDAIADCFAVATCNTTGNLMTVSSQWAPANMEDYWVEFIADSVYSSSYQVNINGTLVSMKDLQGEPVDSSTWIIGSPVRLRVIGANAFLQSAGNGERLKDLEDQVADHIADKNNPHETTALQVGAPTLTQFTNHTEDTNNPHRVTSTQVGAPSTGQFNAHLADYANPHRVSAAQVGAPTTTAFNTLSNSVSAHIASRANPHVVTAAQVGAPTTAAFNTLNTAATNHIASRSNPHVVTAAQAGAIANNNGSFTGTLSGLNYYSTGWLRFFRSGADASGGYDTTYSIDAANNGDFSQTNVTLAINCSAPSSPAGGAGGMLLRNSQTSARFPIFASNTSDPSSIRYKDLIGDASLKNSKKLLDLHMYDYKYKRAKQLLIPDEVYHGPIAEDMFEIDRSYVYLDSEGKPDGIKEERIVYPLLMMVKDLYKENEELKERVSKIEELVNKMLEEK